MNEHHLRAPHTTLGAVADINPETLSGDTPPDQEFRYIDLGSVTHGVVDWTSVLHIRFGSAPSRARRVTQPGDVLFGTVRPALESHTSIPQDARQREYIASTGFAVLRAKQQKTTDRFLYHYSFSELARAEARRSEVGSNYPAVSESDIACFRFPDIPIAQQHHIAEVLDTLDTQIHKTGQTIAKLKLVKRSLLDSLLFWGVDSSGNIRDPTIHCEGFTKSAVGLTPVGWTLGQLGEFTKWLSGGTPSKAHAGFWGGKTPWLTPKDMKSFVVTETADTLTSAGVAAGSQIVPSGAVFIVVRGMILAHSFPVSVIRSPAAFNQDVKAVMPDKRLSGDYLALWFVGQRDRMLRLVSEATHGTKKLDLSDLQAYPCALPPPSEQRRIVTILQAEDDRILDEERLLDKLLALKQGLASDLLTGRVRVPVKAMA